MEGGGSVAIGGRVPVDNPCGNVPQIGYWLNFTVGGKWNFISGLLSFAFLFLIYFLGADQPLSDFDHLQMFYCFTHAIQFN